MLDNTPENAELASDEVFHPVTGKPVRRADLEKEDHHGDASAENTGSPNIISAIVKALAGVELYPGQKEDLARADAAVRTMMETKIEQHHDGLGAAAQEFHDSGHGEPLAESPEPDGMPPARSPSAGRSR